MVYFEVTARNYCCWSVKPGADQVDREEASQIMRVIGPSLKGGKQVTYFGCQDFQCHKIN